MSQVGAPVETVWPKAELSPNVPGSRPELPLDSFRSYRPPSSTVPAVQFGRKDDNRRCGHLLTLRPVYLAMGFDLHNTGASGMPQSASGHHDTSRCRWRGLTSRIRRLECWTLLVLESSTVSVFTLQRSASSCQTNEQKREPHVQQVLKSLCQTDGRVVAWYHGICGW